MTLVRIYVATCKCGNMALNTSKTYEAACHVAQAHKDLNPTKCSPTIFADDVPQALAPGCPHIFKDCTYCIKPRGHKGRHLRPIPAMEVAS